MIADRSRLLRLLQVAVAIGLLALLWQVADGQAALALLSGADPLWLGGALAALTLQTLLSALRWRLTAAQLGIRFDRRMALREYYLSQVVNQVLPGGVLGDAGRAVRARAQAGLLASGQAVVFERLAGQIALFFVLVAALVATFAVPGGFDWPATRLGPAALLAGAALAGAMAVRAAARRFAGRFPTGLARLGRGFTRCLFAPEVRWQQAGLSLGTALCNIAAFGFCAAAIGVHLPVATALVLVPLILFAMVIPVSVSGWGLREGAAAAVFPLAGAAAAEGLAASVAFGLVFLAASLPGLAVLGSAFAPGAIRS